LRELAATIKTNTYALYLASRDRRVPWPAKLVIGVVVAYALSPIDLIPDFVPLLGFVDDLLLLPGGIWLAIRLIPSDVWEECVARAQEGFRKPTSSRSAAVVIVFIWLLLFVGLVVLVRSLVRAAGEPVAVVSV
jgi:uncharacterized membrane protein YkvA (DUF1232 family)